MKKSISKRLKITKRNKVLHRAPGLSHSKTNKRRPQLLRKKKKRKTAISISRVKGMMNASSARR